MSAYSLEIEGLVRNKQRLEAENDRLRAALDKIIKSTEGCRDVSLAAALIHKIAAGALRADTKREPAA